MAVSEVLDRIIDRLMKCCPNVAPDAIDDVGQTTPGDTTFFDVLANDTDLDRDALSIIAVHPDPAIIGDVSVRYNGVHYVADSDWCGVNEFDYEVDDGHGGTARANVTVMVEWGLLISEVEMDPAQQDDDAEWVELYNPSNAEVKLDGWQISYTSNCSAGQGTCWEDLPSYATIEPWGYYVHTFSGEKLHNTSGWQIFLRDPQRLIADITAGALVDTSNNYMSWQRIPDGALIDSAWQYEQSTRGSVNE